MVRRGSLRTAGLCRSFYQYCHRHCDRRNDQWQPSKLVHMSTVLNVQDRGTQEDAPSVGVNGGSNENEIQQALIGLNAVGHLWSVLLMGR